MADLKALEDQLKRIGCNFRFWGRAEIKELANILFPNEIVEICVNGQYEGGFALLVATDQRVLLIDKKPMYLTLEDIRFDMISEVDYNHRMLNASVFICTPSKSLRFVAYNHANLRKLFNFVQTRVMQIRQHYQHQAETFEQALQNQQQQTAAQSQQPAVQPMQPSEYFTTPQQPAEQMSVPAAPVPQRPLSYRVSPLISAYTRLPIMSRQRRYLGSKAMNTPMPSMYGSRSQS